MRKPTKRIRLTDSPDETDRGADTPSKKRIENSDPPIGVNNNALLRAGEGRPRGSTNGVTQQVALGLRSGQSLTTGQVKRGLLEVASFLGFTQKPTDAEIAAFLGPGNGGHRGFLLQTALSRRRVFEKWFERALIPQQIKAELDADGLLARLLSTAAAARSAQAPNSNTTGSNVLDITPSRRSYADD